MDRLVLDLLKEAEYKKGFPPRNHASEIKADFNRRGVLTSSAAIYAISQAYGECVEAVLDEFVQNLLRNISALGVKSLEEIQVIANQAQQKLFTEAGGHLTQEVSFGGNLTTEYSELAIRGLHERFDRISEHINRMISLHKLKGDQETPSAKVGESAPSLEAKKFPFVKDVEVRAILERDYKEIQRAHEAECWKSVIILAGGSVEAILADLLLQMEAVAKASSKAPKGKEIKEWGFVHLILVSVDLNLVNPGVDKLTHTLREYRDLVHPSVEIRTKLKVDAEEAKIALEVLNMVHRDVSARTRP